MDNNFDLFVSAAAKDNHANGRETGWIDAFIKYFAYFFNRSNKNNPVIDISTNLTQSEKYKDPPKKKYDVILIILSRTYLESTNCLKEIELLTNQKDTSKFFFVSLEPLLDTELPEIAKASPLFYFYIHTEAGIHVLDYQHDAKYWFNLLDLSYDINSSLRKGSPEAKKGKIFLAETTEDQSLNRENLKRELILNHYEVVPQKIMPSEKSAVEKEIKEEIRDVYLSIHIIGKDYVELNDNENQSLVEIQNQITSKLCYDSASDRVRFFRIIWIPPGTRKIADEWQSRFIEQLRKNKDLLVGAEIIEIPFEDLKSIVLQRISSRKQILAEPQASNGNSIYLIYDTEDRNKIKPIEDILVKNKIQTSKLNFDANNLDLYENHKKYLLSGDGVIIYYGNDNQDWVKSKLKDIIKAPGYGRKGKFKLKGLITENDLTGIDRKLLKDFTIVDKANKLEQIINSYNAQFNA